jgi:peptide/nickel transport system permease protein
MRRFLLRRLLLLLPSLFGVITVVFFMIHLVPGDPVDLMLGESANPSDRTALRSALRLDRPIGTQYFLFLAGLPRGDWGRSLQTGRPVLEMVSERYPATIELALTAMVLSLFLALPLGVLAAARPRTLADYGALSFALIGVSLPNFWMGPLLILLFALQLDWLPVSGRGGLSHLVLPALTLGMGMAALLTRMIRATLLDVAQREYIATAYAKGLSAKRVILRHALPNALIPILTIAGLQFGSLLAGSVITETIFAWPGIGRLTLQAIQTRDYPLAQGCVLGIALSYLAVNLLVDLAYRFIDPRVRYDV